MEQYKNEQALNCGWRKGGTGPWPDQEQLWQVRASSTSMLIVSVWSLALLSFCTDLGWKQRKEEWIWGKQKCWVTDVSFSEVSHWSVLHTRPSLTLTTALRTEERHLYGPHVTGAQPTPESLFPHWISEWLGKDSKLVPSPKDEADPGISVFQIQTHQP